MKYQILDLLKQTAGLQTGQIVALLGAPRGSVAKALTRLVESKLVVRTVPTHGHPTYALSVTSPQPQPV